MKRPTRELLALLADETRLRALVLLARNDELCVCELTSALDVVQPKVSRHLAALREAGVVLDRRSGQWVYYRIDPGLPAADRRLLDAAVDAASGEAWAAADARRLDHMPNRPTQKDCA